MNLKEATSQIAEQNGIFRAPTGSNATLASCWDINSIQSTQEDLGFRSTSIHQEPTSFRTHNRQSSMPKGTFDAITTKKNAHRRSNTDWSVDSASDASLVDSINSLEDNLPREKLQEVSEDSLEKLKNEIATLKRQADLSEMEIQSLRRQNVKEKKQGENPSSPLGVHHPLIRWKHYVTSDVRPRLDTRILRSGRQQNSPPLVSVLVLK